MCIISLLALWLNISCNREATVIHQAVRTMVSAVTNSQSCLPFASGELGSGLSASLCAWVRAPRHWRANWLHNSPHFWCSPVALPASKYAVSWSESQRWGFFTGRVWCDDWLPCWLVSYMQLWIHVLLGLLASVGGRTECSENVFSLTHWLVWTWFY